MAVRVTQNMLNNNMMRNLNNSMKNMDTMQEQLSSGRKINRPSDDPVVATRGMFYRSSLIENSQFQRNVSEAQSWMEISDNSLNEANSILQRVRELVVQSGDGALEKTSLGALAEEITQIKDHLGNIANQTVGGRYIFNGTDTKNPPYDYDKKQFTSTNSAEIRLEMNKQIFLPINVNGQAIFNYQTDGNNIFNVLDNIVTKLKSGQEATADLKPLDGQIDNFLAERASLGARTNRIELIKDRLANEEVNVTKLMSDNEDVDTAQVITNLKQQENVYRAALGAGSRIIQPTLLDFLR